MGKRAISGEGAAADGVCTVSAYVVYRPGKAQLRDAVRYDKGRGEARDTWAGEASRRNSEEREGDSGRGAERPEGTRAGVGRGGGREYDAVQHGTAADVSSVIRVRKLARGARRGLEGLTSILRR